MFVGERPFYFETREHHSPAGKTDKRNTFRKKNLFSLVGAYFQENLFYPARKGKYENNLFSDIYYMAPDW